MASNSFMDKKMIEEIEKEYQRKIDNTMRRIKYHIEKRMNEIKKQMLQDYYGGYTPKIYVRINQLTKAFGPYSKRGTDGDFITLTFGLSDLEEHGYGANKMDHSEITLHVTYKRKKKTGVFEKDYTYTREDVNEEAIFGYFKEGYHPRVGYADTEPDIWGRASQLIDNFVKDELDNIIYTEISKMK